MGVRLAGRLEDLPPDEGALNQPGRTALLVELADRVLAVSVGHPTRVALDGGTCAGKSTLAYELADEFRRRGIWAVRACADFFKLPPEQRLAGGIGAVYNWSALRGELLEPLGPGGDRLVRTASWDGWTRRSLLDRPKMAVPEESVAVVDGALMLAAPQLDGLWDFRIWVHTDLAVRRERMVVRDVLWADDPSPEALRRRFDTRSRPDEENYRVERRAEAVADAVVNNNDPGRPRLLLSEASTGSSGHGDAHRVYADDRTCSLTRRPPVRGAPDPG